jgi:hypothetical protein
VLGAVSVINGAGVTTSDLAPASPWLTSGCGNNHSVGMLRVCGADGCETKTSACICDAEFFEHLFRRFGRDHFASGPDELAR